jgi:hypothetical protein
MLRVRRALPKQNNGWEDKVQANVHEDGKPDQCPKTFGEIEHEDVGANAQFDERHPIEIEKLAEPEIAHVLFQFAGLFEYGVVNVFAAADFGHFITAHCAGDGENLAI